jgi:integrative and conjugative element protein (TIGR02256 family)
VYIRGCKGLTQRVDEIERITDGMLGYVGEWHSHPRNCGCSPSEDDRKAFRWLARNMNVAGFPALMLIVGDEKQYCWYLGQMP